MSTFKCDSAEMGSHRKLRTEEGCTRQRLGRNPTALRKTNEALCVWDAGAELAVWGAALRRGQRGHYSSELLIRTNVEKTQQVVFCHCF